MSRHSTFFRHILTGKDNSTYDIVRVGMLASFIVVCGESVWGICACAHIEPVSVGEMMKSFSFSVANILGWGSVGCAAKAHTEPQGGVSCPH
jgi:hypothetical protein